MGVKAVNVDEVIGQLSAGAAAIPDIAERIGDFTAGNIRKKIQKHTYSERTFHKSKAWLHSIFSAPGSRKGEVVIGTDLSIAPYGKIRETGGIITAYKSKFRDKSGTPLLFVPRTPDARPGAWKFLTRGVDFSLCRSVRHPATHYMEYEIDAGVTPALDAFVFGDLETAMEGAT